MLLNPVDPLVYILLDLSAAVKTIAQLFFLKHNLSLAFVTQVLFSNHLPGHSYTISSQGHSHLPSQ